MTELKYNTEFLIDPSQPASATDSSYSHIIRFFVNALPELSLESQRQGIRVIDAFIAAETKGRVCIEGSTLEWLKSQLETSGSKIFKGVVAVRLLGRLDETIDSVEVEPSSNSHDAEADKLLVSEPSDG